MQTYIRRARPYLFILFAFIIPIVFIGIPLLQGAYLSFFKGPIIGGKAFAGLSNYYYIVSERYFIEVIINTMIWTASIVLGTFLIGLGAALLLSRSIRGRWLFRGLILLPWVIPPVAVSLTFKWIYNPGSGILNVILYNVGLIDSFQPWLGDPSLALPACIVAAVWKSYPFVTIILLAGLQAIPQDLYEAARVDGAGPSQQLRYITLPQLKKPIFLVLILQTIWAFNQFSLVFVLTGGGPSFSTTLLSLLVYRAAFEWLNPGVAGAVAVIMLVVMLILYLAYTKYYFQENQV